MSVEWMGAIIHDFPLIHGFDHIRQQIYVEIYCILNIEPQFFRIFLYTKRLVF